MFIRVKYKSLNSVILFTKLLRTEYSKKKNISDITLFLGINV